MTRFRALTALALLPLAGCTSFGIASTDGPLLTPHAHGYGGFHVEVGEPVTHEFEVLFNQGDKPARVTSVELIDTPRQLQLVDALIGGERTENHQFEPLPPAAEEQPKQQHRGNQSVPPRTYTVYR